MIRYRLDELQKLGYVSKTKGKGGTILTYLGVKKVRDII